jgi:hypothetical protein
MKFFPYELIATANEWLDKPPKVVIRAVKRLDNASMRYNHHLDHIRQRVPSRAWHFFRHEIMDKSLHDASLLQLRVEDVLPGTARKPLDRKGRSITTVSLDFLAYHECWIGEFKCKQVQNIKADLRVESPLFRNLGDLYIYELRAISSTTLALGFLFSSGSEIEIEFKQLSFRRRIVKKQKPNSVLIKQGSFS